MQPAHPQIEKAGEEARRFTLSVDHGAKMPGGNAKGHRVFAKRAILATP
ncbi:MAG TPA: hypothetical protein P5534_15565 [Candidatus Paceibacterota bacterium]|nr:hypothetical protein [Candidatus Paceibacterota bacterium]HRZ57338.1 hypothetical protein [Candidatus Paceibacterota bacterium]